MLDAFIVHGTPEEIPKIVRERYGDVVSRISFNSPQQADSDKWTRVLEGFRA
jgi:hypothetical protein